MNIKFVDDPDAKPLKKKEKIAIQKQIIEEQEKIIEWLEEINTSDDPHSNVNENNILWLRIENAKELIEGLQAKLDGKKVQLTVYRPVAHGEIYSSADM